MLKIVLVAFLFLFAHADLCIFYATQKKIHDNEDERFLKRFDSSKIFFDGRYYRFLIGPFSTKGQASSVLKKARRYSKDAFIRSCPSYAVFDKNIPSQAKPAQEAPEQLPKADDVQISKVFKKRVKIIRRKHKKIPHPRTGSQHPQAPVEQNTTSDLIEKKSQPEASAKEILEDLQKERFYRLSFYEFIDRFLFHSPYGKSESYDYRLKKLDALLEDVPYNWDIFLHGAIRYTKFIDFYLSQNKELSLQGGLGVNKRLFDSGYLVKNSIKAFRKNLAKIQYINAKDRLYLYGAQIYLNALLAQRIKDLYEQNFFEQKAFAKLIEERYKSKVATRVDEIDAQDDLLNIKKSLLEKLYAYLYSDYLLRNSADLNTSEPLKLSWFGMGEENKDLEEYYKQTLAHSPLIQEQRLKSEIERKRVLKFKYFFLPQIDFNSLVYHERRKDFFQHQSTSGLDYQVGLNIKIPLYNETLLDDLERSQVRSRLERERLKAKMKDVIKDVHKTYNEIKKLSIKRTIVEKQLALAKEKIALTKKRYLAGIGIYRDYSDAIKEMLSYQEELYNIDAALLTNKIFLHLLEGIQRPYE